MLIQGKKYPQSETALTFNQNLNHTHSCIPTYLIQSILFHLQNKLQLHKNMKHLHIEAKSGFEFLKIQQKQSEFNVDGEKLESLQESIRKIIDLLKNFNSKKNAHKQINIQGLDMENFTWNDLPLDKLPLSELKTILKKLAEALFDRLALFSQKKKDVKKEIHQLEKQINFDNHISKILSLIKEKIIDPLIEIGKAAEQELVHIGEEIIELGIDLKDKLFGDKEEEEIDQLEARLNPGFPIGLFDANNKMNFNKLKKTFDNTIQSESVLNRLSDSKFKETYSHIKNTLGVFDREIQFRFPTKTLGVNNFGSNYANAFYNGQYIVFGNGNRYIDPLYKSLAIAAHELGHPIVEEKLNYQDQSGALNESYADIFGKCVEFASLADQLVPMAERNWDLGNVIRHQKQLLPLRTFEYGKKAYVGVPALGGDDPQPDDMSKESLDRLDPALLANDEGGVHIFSKIPNIVFREVCIAHNSWQIPLKFWVDVLNDIRDPNITFEKFAGLQIAKAESKGDLILAETLRKAWDKVKVTPVAPSVSQTVQSTEIAA